MLDQQHFKKVHITVFVFLLVCVLITFHSLLKGEFRRVAQERQAASELLQEAIQSSLTSYEKELSELIPVLNTKQINSVDDFNLAAQSLMSNNQPVVEHILFSRHKSELPFLSDKKLALYSYPDLSLSSNELSPVHKFYKTNMPLLLKSKKTLLSPPLSLTQTFSSDVHSAQPTDFFILRRYRS